MAHCGGLGVLCLCIVLGGIAYAQQTPATEPSNPQPNAAQSSSPQTPSPQAPSPQAPSKLNINVVEGAGAVNNIRTRAAREFAVEVDDENDKPVAGAVVTFLAPNQGPGGSFAGDTQLLTVMSGQDGHAVAGSYRPNSAVGDYNIQVTATYGGETASAAISQSNRALAVAAAKKSNKKVLILVAVAAAVAVGAGAGLAGGHGSGSSSSSSASTTPTATLGVGSGVTVGAPH
jgi:hypothetical protein